MSHEEEQRTYFAAARLCWPEGWLRVFFCLKKAFGLLQVHHFISSFNSWLLKERFIVNGNRYFFFFWGGGNGTGHSLQVKIFVLDSKFGELGPQDSLFGESMGPNR